MGIHAKQLLILNEKKRILNFRKKMKRNSEKIKIGKNGKNKVLKKSKKLKKNKEKIEMERKQMNAFMDSIVEQTKGKLKKEEKKFEKIGIPEQIKTEEIENL